MSSLKLGVFMKEDVLGDTLSVNEKVAYIEGDGYEVLSGLFMYGRSEFVI